MSFLADPNLYDYQGPPDICNQCFGADETNHSVFLCFQGIRMGTAVPGVDPDPPNGVWEINPIDPCVFGAFINPYLFSAILTPTPAYIRSITPATALVQFYSEIVGTCHILFQNSFQNPGDPYYGGYALLVPPLACNLDNLEDLMALIPWDPTDPTYSQPRPKSLTESTYTLSRRRDSSNLRILFEH